MPDSEEDSPRRLSSGREEFTLFVCPFSKYLLRAGNRPDAINKALNKINKNLCSQGNCICVCVCVCVDNKKKLTRTLSVYLLNGDKYYHHLKIKQERLCQGMCMGGELPF